MVRMVEATNHQTDQGSAQYEQEDLDVYGSVLENRVIVLFRSVAISQPVVCSPSVYPTETCDNFPQASLTWTVSLLDTILSTNET